MNNPYNLKTKKEYRGMNQILLQQFMSTHPLENDPAFITAHQAKTIGASIKKDAQGIEIKYVAQHKNNVPIFKMATVYHKSDILY